jgi:flap endonuclease-1
MGVNISDILSRERRTIEDFKGKWIAIDAYNTLYQFISIIRQPDGTPLMDSHDRITSHLTGLLFRTSNFLDAQIKPVFVFDGKPHELKEGTLLGRRRVKEKAKLEWQQALDEGDLEKAKSKAQQTSVLTPEMVKTSKEFLGYFGVPCVQAPADGEAQASYMAGKNDVWASASQDYDSLLFGTPRLIRNLTVTGKRKLPRRREYVNVEPEEVNLEETLKSLEITLPQLVDLAIMVGTDFNMGVKGIGAKTGLKLLKKHNTLENIIKEKELDIPDYQEVRDIFLKPDVTDDYKIQMGKFSEEKIIKLLVDDYEFSENRVTSALKKVKDRKKEEGQKKLDSWF